MRIRNAVWCWFGMAVIRYESEMVLIQCGCNVVCQKSGMAGNRLIEDTGRGMWTVGRN